jgi:hypothetical protein
MKTIMQAMAQMEGFYKSGTRPERNCNPGDIEWGRFTQAHGATGGDPRFAIFPTVDAGFAAMRALLLSAYAGLTLAVAMNKWAPPVENQTNVYIKVVCELTGLTPDTILTAENIG